MFASALFALLLEVIANAIPKLPAFHPDARIAFPIEGAKVTPKQLAAYPIEVFSLDSFDLEVGAARMDSLPRGRPKFEIVRRIRLRKPRDSGSHWTVRVDLESVDRKQGGGYVQLEAKAPSVWQDFPVRWMDPDTLWARKVVQSAALAIIATRLGQSRMRICVVDRLSGKVQAGAKVFAGDPGNVVTGRTDARGNFDLDWNGDGQILVRQGRNFDWFPAEPEDWEENARKPYRQTDAWHSGKTYRTIPARGKPREGAQEAALAIFSHKTAYKPGDSLIFDCLARRAPANATDSVAIRLHQPSGEIFPGQQWNWSVEPLEHLRGRWKLPDSLPLGMWTLEGKLGQVYSWFRFEVEDVRMPSIPMALRMDGLDSLPTLKLSVRTRPSAIEDDPDSVRWEIHFEGDPAKESSSVVYDSRFLRNVRSRLGDLDIPPVDSSLKTEIAMEGLSAVRLRLPVPILGWRRGTLSAKVSMELPGGRRVVDSLSNLRPAYGVEPRLHFQRFRDSLRVTAVAIGVDGTSHRGIPLRLAMRFPSAVPTMVDATLRSGGFVDIPLPQRAIGGFFDGETAIRSLDAVVRSVSGGGVMVRAEVPMSLDLDSGFWKPSDSLSNSWESVEDSSVGDLDYRDPIYPTDRESRKKQT